MRWICICRRIGTREFLLRRRLDGREENIFGICFEGSFIGPSFDLI